MPTLEAHLKEAEKNEELAELLLQGGRYPSWGVTVLHYAALHYVEAALARLHIHSLDHGDRTRNIARYLRYVHTDYGVLRNLSEDARYDCLQIGPSEVEEARRCYAAIKGELQSRVPLSERPG